jgi:uncharacterized membrane protein YfcA
LYPVLLHVLAVIFVATLIRSAFGFGEALIAVPLLALTVPVEIAAPLAALVSITRPSWLYRIGGIFISGAPAGLCFLLFWAFHWGSRC